MEISSSLDPASMGPLRALHLGSAADPAAQRELMEELNTQMADLLLQTRDTMLAEGPTTMTNPTGHHYRPRLVSLQRDGLIKLRKKVVHALRQENMEEAQLPAEVCKAVEALNRTDVRSGSSPDVIWAVS